MTTKRPCTNKTGTRRNVYMNEDTRQPLIDIGMKAGAKEGRAASLGLRISAAYHERLVEALRDCMECLDMKEGSEPYDSARALLAQIEAGKGGGGE